MKFIPFWQSQVATVMPCLAISTPLDGALRYSVIRVNAARISTIEGGPQA